LYKIELGKRGAFRRVIDAFVHHVANRKWNIVVNYRQCVPCGAYVGASQEHVDVACPATAAQAASQAARVEQLLE